MTQRTLEDLRYPVEAGALARNESHGCWSSVTGASSPACPSSTTTPTRLTTIAMLPSSRSACSAGSRRGGRCYVRVVGLTRPRAGDGHVVHVRRGYRVTLNNALGVRAECDFDVEWGRPQRRRPEWPRVLYPPGSGPEEAER
jgi:hypothetical protein